MMDRLLLDTHAVIWLLADRLSPSAQTALRDASCVMVSHFSFWEIAIKSSLGKLSLVLPGLDTRLANHGFELLPITLEHILRLHYLPHHHRDPFDRMLVAQAQVEGLTLMTRDRGLGEYGIATLDA